jgi:PilZ domain
MNANRRLQERKQPERMVFCKLGGEKSGSVPNLSEDGLRFESLTPIEEKDLLQLRLSGDLNSAIEATGQLAWIDSAKRTGGLRFLGLSVPAREQIRAWLRETSTASFLRKRDKQAEDGAATEKPLIWQEMRVASMQLVPIERHRARMRWQFLGGILVGFGICAVVMIPAPTLKHTVERVFRYAGGTKPGSPARTTASANRAAQTQAPVAPPVSPSASISHPTATKPLATEPAAVQPVSVAAPKGSPQRQSPQTAGASSTDLMTRTSSPWATPQPAKAEQPLGASLAAVAPAPAASKAHSSSGQVQHPKKVSATSQQLWSALQAGNMRAAVALADLYTRGEGVPANCEQARILLLVASEKNNAEASKKLQELDKGGCPANSE